MKDGMPEQTTMPSQVQPSISFLKPSMEDNVGIIDDILGDDMMDHLTINDNDMRHSVKLTEEEDDIAMIIFED